MFVRQGDVVAVHSWLRKLLVVPFILCIIGIPVIGLLNNWWGNQDGGENHLFWWVFAGIVNPVAVIFIGGLVVAALWGSYKMLLFLIDKLTTHETEDEQKAR